MPESSEIPGSRAGLLVGVASLIKNFLALVVNRIELAALELSEVRKHCFRLAILCVFAAILGWFAIGLWSLLAIVLLWNTMGWKIILIMASIYTFMAMLAIYLGLRMVRQGKFALPATLAELKNDRDILLPE